MVFFLTKGAKKILFCIDYLSKYLPDVVKPIAERMVKVSLIIAF